MVRQSHTLANINASINKYPSAISIIVTNDASILHAILLGLQQRTKSHYIEVKQFDKLCKPQCEYIGGHVEDSVQ